MQQEGSSRIPWTILGSAFLLGFAMWSPMFCVPPMGHILREQLLLTYAQTSLLYSAPILMVAAVAIPGGLLADRIGAKKAAGIGVIIIAVGTILRGTATDASSLLAFTFLYGAGLGLAFPSLPKLVSVWVPRERAGVAMGIFQSGIPVGNALVLALTMLVVFPITNTFQGVFFFWSIPPIITAILWWILVKEPPRNETHDEMVSSDSALTLLNRVLRNKNLWLLAILLMSNEFFFHAWTGWAPTLMRLKEASPELAGLMTSLTVWVLIPSILLMPRLSNRLGLRKPFLWVPAIILALVAWGAMHVSLSMSWLFMALVGVASATRYITILTLPVEMMPKEEVGTASGLVLAIGFTGGGIGPLIAGRILDLTGSLDLSFLVLAGLSIAAAGIAFMIPETGPKASGQQQ